MDINILIIEDEAIVAQDIEAILLDLGYSVASIIHRSDKAIDYLSFHSPDLVLCDISIKGEKDGIEVAETIRERKNIPFIFLTSFADRNTLSRAKKVLPYGYIVKPFDAKDLLSAIEVAMFKFNQELDSLRITAEKVNTITHTDLTDKEYEILMLMVQGETYESICQSKEISNNTLKYHMKNIFQKFDAKSKAEILQQLLVKLRGI
ncbi:MAG: response regulator [Saprospiraceae bacterium]|nr:response regulator [Saprospiraceae bacterium]